jgi:hypothetical protein
LINYIKSMNAIIFLVVEYTKNKNKQGSSVAAWLSETVL